MKRQRNMKSSISVVVDGHCSSPMPINSGVPQGSVLSPTLFLLLINDLHFIINCSIHPLLGNACKKINRAPERQLPKTSLANRSVTVSIDALASESSEGLRISYRTISRTPRESAARGPFFPIHYSMGTCSDTHDFLKNLYCQVYH